MKQRFFQELAAKPKRCDHCGRTAKVTDVLSTDRLKRRQYCDGCLVGLPPSGLFVPTPQQVAEAEGRLAGGAVAAPVSEARALRHLWMGWPHTRPGRLD